MSARLDLIDTVKTPVADLVKTLSDISRNGVWLNPFRGFPKGPHLSRFDVVYLDETGRVIETIENFAEIEFEPLHDKFASALVLPAHTLAAKRVQKGDQLRICRDNRVLTAAADLSDEPPIREERCIRDVLPRDVIASEAQTPEPSRLGGRAKSVPEPDQKPSLKVRILRWLFPDAEPLDRRHGVRRIAPELVAYYWTGGAPIAYQLRNVSESGLYLLTEERWLPGTRLVMTLQKNGPTEGSEEISRVESQVVRWGEDGVGFRFVESGFVDLNTGEIVEGKSFDRAAFARFLDRAAGPAPATHPPHIARRQP